MQNPKKFTNIPAPILAIFAVPRGLPPVIESQFGGDTAAFKAFKAQDKAYFEAEVAAFEKGLPTARVVRLPYADHYVFRSNEADVLREMHAFIDGLP